MRTYKLYATLTSSQDAAVSVIIQKSCRIKSVRWEAGIDQAADNSSLACELSTRATNQLTSNDTVGDVSCLRQFGNFTTSGAINGGARKQEFIDFPVSSQERLYLHAVITTTTGYVTCYVDVAE